MAEFTQVSILSELRHPNIVMLMGASLRAPNLCMVFEWCEGGSLYNVLRRAGSDLGRQQRFCIATCVASAIAFLHTGSPAIIHRDIKAQNVLLDDPLNPVSAKLCDFGLAIKLSDAADTNACQGTPPCVPLPLLRTLLVCTVHTSAPRPLQLVPP
jgi:serine/threonine protein kinase